MTTENILTPDFSAAPENIRSSIKALERGLADYAARSWEAKEIFLAERFADARNELSLWADLARCSRDLPFLAGLRMTVKACFDVEGWTTHCASEVLRSIPPSKNSSNLVSKLRRAGATLVAQTNMTEFAYGALGMNSHFGTPRTPLDPDDEQVAGGSSSGAAAAVARGYCDFSICSDTSGSSRIPAAFCGVVGFKPSHGRYPDDGMIPLSQSFDVPGLIASSAALCRAIDAVIAGNPREVERAPVLRRVQLALPAWLDQAELDSEVSRDFRSAILKLEANGVGIVILPLDVLQRSSAVALHGGIIAAEAYRTHREHLGRLFESYDPRVGPRLLKGKDISAYQYLDGLHQLAACRRCFDEAMAPFDGFVLPTVPILPPRIAALEDTDRYLALNSRSFSLTEFANRLDLPSISLPIGHRSVGLMITGTRNSDRALLSIATTLEPIIKSIGQ